MARIVLLDSGVVGLLCSAPENAERLRCQNWVTSMSGSNASVVLTEATYFEVKRGLLWKDSTGKLARFEDLVRRMIVIPINRDAWDKAAEFWALLYKSGRPTADPKSLDGDAVLAGAAITIIQPGDHSVIATTNVGHLNRFPGVDARLWQDIGRS